MKELGGGKTLLEFVCDLPILKAVDEDRGEGAFLSLSTTGSPTEIAEEMTSVVKR